MSKAKVRPPRAPRDERAKITIALQVKEIALLANRCSDLVEARDAALSRAAKSEMELMVARRNLANEQQFRSADLMRLTEAKAEIMRLTAHVEGYRMALADFMQPEKIPRIG